MLTPPALAAATIRAKLRQRYGLRVVEVVFLPLGADANAAVYRATADGGTAYFLKLKRGGFDPVAATVPAFLRARGITQVMAPLPTLTGRLWARGHGFVWLLYPFFEGHNGFAVPLTDVQWLTLGQSLRAIHDSALPPALRRLVPREDFGPRWRDTVTQLDQEIERYAATGDPLARELAAFWIARRRLMRTLVERAAMLGERLRTRECDFVLCHTDLHAGNVLLGAHGELAIVDWDETLLAPRERDLMFVGGGVGTIWDSARELTRFYAGYRAPTPATPDPVALAYYRYERIVADIAAYGEQIFGERGSVADRKQGLRNLTGQFAPNRVVAIAHHTYSRVKV